MLLRQLYVGMFATDGGHRSGTERVGDALPEGRYRLLLPVAGETMPADAERRLRTATAIARERDGGLVVCSIVNFARQTPLDAVAADEPKLVAARETAERFVETVERTGVPVTGRVHLTHRESDSVLNAVEAYECDGVSLAIRGGQSQRRRLLTGDVAERVVARAECEVFVEKQAADETPVETVLLAVSGGPHSGLAAQAARALALDTDARIDAIHFMPEDASDEDHEEGTRIVEAAERALADVERVEATVEAVENVGETIISRSDAYDLTVLGSPTGGLLAQFVFGTVPDSVNQRTENAVLMARDDTGSKSIYERWVVGDASE
ncbi:cationic amino acid transporter [Halococcus hamelinensis 100A6]|uniref:Cationic amino acid transporter n=2 Tax=Halococcus hamelinensis TaxID=332168 RepID=M0LWT9_9EURY|nr:cationic amino acid transporter [Halococcus hamelinensis 100A6]